MAELKKGKSMVTLTGKVKLSENSFSDEKISDKSGYRYKRISFGIETAEGSRVFAELMGGYSPAKPVVYVTSKEDNTSFQIGWAERTNKAVMDSVADYRKYKVGLSRDNNGKMIIKEFLSPFDMHDYLKENIKEDMEVTVRGAFTFSEYKGETQRKIEIQNIYLPYQQKDEEGNLLPVQYSARFVQTILLDEDSFKRITKDDAKDGEVTVSAVAPEYIGKKDGKEIKKTLPFPQPITVKIDKENPEMTEKLLDKLFKVGKGKVREMTIEGYIIEGYEQQQVSQQDIKLSDEIKDLIAMGLYTEEEAMKKMMVRGNKVSKLVFTRPFLQKDKDGNLIIPIDDTKYTPEDLYPPQLDVEEEVKEDPFAGLSDEGTGNDDWMKALSL